MRILVTGGAGFIGSNIVDLLIDEGHDVFVVDDLSTGNRANLNSRARFHEIDIRRPELHEVIAQERPEVVSHQAARANVRESFELPLLYADINILGSLNLLEACRTHGVRKVIYASTGGAVYGEPEYLPVREDHPIHPLDPYGASKHHVEHYLDIYRASYGLDYTILRYPNVFGPRQDPYGEAGVISIFANQMLRGESPRINGTGQQERDFVHVYDIARANLMSLDRGDGSILNLGWGKGISLNQVTELLCKLTGYRGEVNRGPAKAGEVFKTCLDSARAREVLGWEPRFSLEEGLANTVAYFRAK